MGVAGADVGQSFVLLTGFGGLLAGAISMGLGEWVSVRSSKEAFERQVSIERDELRLMPEEEQEELALIYEAKGLDPVDARRMAESHPREPQSALDTLTREELGMSEEEAGNPWTAAAASFSLFAVGALLPILPWLFASGMLGLGLSAVFSGFGLFALGAATSSSPAEGCCSREGDAAVRACRGRRDLPGRHGNRWNDRRVAAWEPAAGRPDGGYSILISISKRRVAVVMAVTR